MSVWSIDMYSYVQCSSLASLEPEPDGRSGASLWVQAWACLPNVDHLLRHSRIQSLILSEPRLRASVPPDQPLQMRVVQSSVIVSYQKVCSPAGPHRLVMPTLEPAGPVSLYRG